MSGKPHSALLDQDDSLKKQHDVVDKHNNLPGKHKNGSGRQHKCITAINAQFPFFLKVDEQLCMNKTIRCGFVSSIKQQPAVLEHTGATCMFLFVIMV